MADNNGDPATNFAFNKLSGSDTAGHNSINDMLSSFDDKLGAAMSNMLVLYPGTVAPTGPQNAAKAPMWTIQGTSFTVTSGNALNLPAGTYCWIKKVN